MDNKGKALKNIVLVSQISICVMVPLFVCVALGVWLDGKLNTNLFSLVLSILGISAGGRNAYALVKATIVQDEAKRKREEEALIKEKVERYNREHNNNEREEKIKDK